MKNNVSLKLALASMKKEKKQYLISFIVIILSFMIVIAIYNTLYNDQIISQKTREEQYGNWNICLEDTSQKDLELIKNTKDYESITDIELTGILDDDSQIANYQNDFFQLAHIELTGQVPKNDNEIIVKKGLGKIGETLSLTFNKQTNQYKVVGTINDYDEKWCMSAYDYFTYKLTPIHHQTYIKGNPQYGSVFSDAVFNLLLDDTVVYRASAYNRNNNEGTGFFVSVDFGENENETFNIVLAFAIIGLFVGISYNMSQRKERLLLLRSLGMSNRQMRDYIFYETICLVLISLIISFVLGYSLSWFMSYMISLLTGQYYFSFQLFALFPYIGILILMTFIASYFSYMIISLQSQDSLIHKKRRMKIKKYNKAHKMNVFHITNKEIRNHYNLILCIIVLSAYLLYALTSFVYYNRYNAGAFSYQIYDGEGVYYKYSLKSSQSIRHNKKKIEYMVGETKFSENYMKDNAIATSGSVIYENGQGHFYFDTISELMLTPYQKDDDFMIYKGRRPEKNNECLYGVHSNTPEISNIDLDYDVGDTISLCNINDQSQIEYEIVGIAYFYNSYDNFLYSEGNHFSVLEDSIPESEWSYFYTFYDNKDLSFYFNKNYDDFSLSMEYNNITYTKSMIKDLLYSFITIMIGIVFLILILKIFIDKVVKDLKLMRCLGMTNKQMIKMICYILGYCFIIVLGIYSLYIINSYTYMIDSIYRKTFIIIFISYFIVMFVTILLMTYFKLRKRFIFLPSDVQRYY